MAAKTKHLDWALLKARNKQAASNVALEDIAAENWTHGWQSDDYDWPPDFEHSPIGGSKSPTVIPTTHP